MKEVRVTFKNVVDSTKSIILTVVDDDDTEKVSEIMYNLPDSVSFGKAEEYRKFMEETKKSVEDIATVWAAVYGAKECGKLVINDGVPATGKIFAEATELCDRYNKASLAEALKDCAEDENPMMHAATRLLYPTISVKETNKKDELARLDVVERLRRIPIDRLHKSISGGIGANKMWIYEAQAVNMVFTARAFASVLEKGDPEEILSKISDSDHMKEIAKKITLGETPTSETKLLEHLRECIGMMLGDEWKSKVKSQDSRHVRDLYITEHKKDPTGQTKAVMTHKKFYDMLLVVCHKIVTGGEWKVFCKELQ